MYTVVFYSRLKRMPPDPEYEAMAERMIELARSQPGFIDVKSARDSDGNGITISYWESREAIAAWGRHPEHLVAQERGKREWYVRFETQLLEAITPGVGEDKGT